MQVVHDASEMSISMSKAEVVQFWSSSGLFPLPTMERVNKNCDMLISPENISQNLPTICYRETSWVQSDTYYQLRKLRENSFSFSLANWNFALTRFYKDFNFLSCLSVSLTFTIFLLVEKCTGFFKANYIVLSLFLIHTCKTNPFYVNF